MTKKNIGRNNLAFRKISDAKRLISIICDNNLHDTHTDIIYMIVTSDSTSNS